MTIEAIKDSVLKMQPPTEVRGRMNIEEWRIKKAAELGYMTALYDAGIYCGNYNIKPKHQK